MSYKANDRISVAMATFNGEAFLREQLDSLYRQTLPPFEVVVSDDHSTDGTIDILKEYHDNYGLQYSVNEHNIGVNQNFEKAIRACKGEYIAISDQDDVWFPEKIEVCYKKLKEIEGNQPALVSSQCYHINNKGEVISKGTCINIDSSSCADTILHPPGVTQGCSMMFNRKLLELLKPFPSSEVIMYDGYIGLVGTCVGIKYNIAKPLFYHRHHHSNVTSPLNQGKRKETHWFYFLRKFIEPVFLPQGRGKQLMMIQEEYGELFHEEAKAVCAKAIRCYMSKSIIGRMISILKMTELDDRLKYGLMAGVLAARIVKKQ